MFKRLLPLIFAFAIGLFFFGSTASADSPGPIQGTGCQWGQMCGFEVASETGYHTIDFYGWEYFPVGGYFQEIEAAFGFQCNAGENGDCYDFGQTYDEWNIIWETWDYGPPDYGQTEYMVYARCENPGGSYYASVSPTGSGTMAAPVHITGSTPVPSNHPIGPAPTKAPIKPKK